MNISNLVEMSSLINSGALVKWEFMSGGVMRVIPLYQEGYPNLIRDKDEKVLLQAYKFLDSALAGMNLKDNHNGALPEDHLTSSRTFEMSLKVLLSLPSTFQIQEWDSIQKKMTCYKELINNICQKKKLDAEDKTTLDELWIFFQTLAEIARKKRVASVFSHTI
jgi:hypothetical protein